MQQVPCQLQPAPCHASWVEVHASSLYHIRFSMLLLVKDRQRPPFERFLLIKWQKGIPIPVESSLHLLPAIASSQLRGHREEHVGLWSCFGSQLGFFHLNLKILLLQMFPFVPSAAQRLLPPPRRRVSCSRGPAA